MDLSRQEPSKNVAPPPSRGESALQTIRYWADRLRTQPENEHTKSVDEYARRREVEELERQIAGLRSRAKIHSQLGGGGGMLTPGEYLGSQVISEVMPADMRDNLDAVYKEQELARLLRRR